MAIKFYLAMTAEEIAENKKMPNETAWIYCPFSAHSDILSQIPAGVIPILTDSSPVDRSVTDSLVEEIRRSTCEAVILDFQQPGDEDALALSKSLIQALPCPVIVSDLYAAQLECPVFLSPLPHHRPLADHIAPWKGRDIWLDISTEGQSLCVAEQGSSIHPLPRFQPAENGFSDNNLHCHYTIQLHEKEAVFTLWRTQEDLVKLITEAESCGVAAAVGLYQELGALLYDSVSGLSTFFGEW